MNGTWRGLRRLVEHGLVSEQEAGRRAALLYTLNRAHVAADAALLLTRLRERFFERVKETLAAWPVQPVHVSVFGSAARGDGDTASDVDIFIVRSDDVVEDDEQWREQVDGLAASVLSWTGNHAGIAEVSETDLRRLGRERPPIVAELEEHAVALLGLSAPNLFERSHR